VQELYLPPNVWRDIRQWKRALELKDAVMTRGDRWYPVRGPVARECLDHSMHFYRNEMRVSGFVLRTTSQGGHSLYAPWMRMLSVHINGRYQLCHSRQMIPVSP